MNSWIRNLGIEDYVVSPAVSVAMSVFNGQAFLREAVESILAQTFTDFEFIIIDDGSTDKTAEILSQYAKRDGRVRVVSQENRGRAESLNRGIELARAPLIARMDADDISLPHRLKEQVDCLKDHPEVGLLGGAYERIDADGRARGIARFPVSDSEIRTVMLQDNPICHPAVMMRKEVALACGGYRKQLLDADDYDLWLRIAEHTQLANLDQIILKYRIHRRQASTQNTKHQTWCVLAARAAASLRRRGGPDPLSHAKEVTPEVLRDLGVTEAETQRALVGAYGYWMRAFYQTDPELALRIFNDDLLRLSSANPIERPVLADLWLKAAAIHYRQGRLLQALLSASRGVLIRPIVAGRPIKRAVTRLARRAQP